MFLQIFGNKVSFIFYSILTGLKGNFLNFQQVPYFQVVPSATKKLKVLIITAALHQRLVSIKVLYVLQAKQAQVSASLV